MAQPDLDRIKRNVAKMASQGAPEADIDGYIQSEGVTLDAVRAHKTGPEPGFLSRAASAVGTAIMGKQDPAYKDLPDFSSAPGITLENNPMFGGAKMFGTSDEQYGDIIAKNLGERLIKREKDAHGYEVITYRGDDGGTHQAYVNRPGIDWQDVDRAVSQSVPYLAAGGLMGKVLGRGAPVMLKAAMQAPAMAGTSIAADKAASVMGSDQPADLTRAGIAAAGGVVSELAGPAISAVARTVKGNKAAAAGLTPELRNAMFRAGMTADDIANMTDDQIRAFARGKVEAAHTGELASTVRTGEFDIPTTLGQRTKNPGLLLDEKDARYGALGEVARQEMKRLDTEQANAIRAQVLGGSRPVAGGRQEVYGIAPQIAPTRGPTTGPRDLGEGIREGLQTAQKFEKAAESAAWDAVPDMVPRVGAFDTFDDTISNAVRQTGIRVDLPIAAGGETTTPIALRMGQLLEKFKTGNAIATEGPGVFQQASIKTVDEMRRQLLQMSRAAAPRSPDAYLANAVYDGFNEWIEKAALAGKLSGDPEGVAALIQARQVTREMKGIFAPTMGNKKTPAARILEDVMERADSPERIVSTLLGSAGTQRPPNAGTVQALQHVKMIKDRMAARGTQGGADLKWQAQNLWDDVRLSYWQKMVTDNKGEPLTPGRLVSSMEQTFRNQGSVVNTLFSKEEQALMRRFLSAMKDVAYVDPNPSGSGSALARLKAGSSVARAAKAGLTAHASRETLVKGNILRGRIYRMIAKAIPPGGIFNAKDAVGARVAAKSVTQEFMRKPRPTFGGYGGAIGAQIGRDDR